MKIFSGCIVVAATVDVVTLAHIAGKRNLPFLVNVPGKTGFPAASGTDGLAARFVFLKMESIFVHNVVDYVFLQMNTTICSLQFLQSCRNFPFSVLRNCKTAKTAGCNKGSDVAVSWG